MIDYYYLDYASICVYLCPKLFKCIYSAFQCLSSCVNNINKFCGNGQCEPFETKKTCLEDCGSILDLMIDKVRSSAGSVDGGSGIFGKAQRSGIILMLSFVALIIVLVTFGIILIAIYNMVVASIEREVIVD